MENEFPVHNCWPNRVLVNGKRDHTNFGTAHYFNLQLQVKAANCAERETRARARDQKPETRDQRPKPETRDQITVTRDQRTVLEPVRAKARNGQNRVPARFVWNRQRARIDSNVRKPENIFRRPSVSNIGKEKGRTG